MKPCSTHLPQAALRHCLAGVQAAPPGELPWPCPRGRPQWGDRPVQLFPVHPPARPASLPESAPSPHHTCVPVRGPPLVIVPVQVAGDPQASVHKLAELGDRRPSLPRHPALRMVGVLDLSRHKGQRERTPREPHVSFGRPPRTCMPPREPFPASLRPQ